MVFTVTHWKVKTMMASAANRFGRKRTTRYHAQENEKSVWSKYRHSLATHAIR